MKENRRLKVSPKNQKSSKSSCRGITLVVLIITIVMLIILVGITIDFIVDNKVYKEANYTSFGTKIRTYQQQVDSYIIRQGVIDNDVKTITNKEEIKKIIPDITEEDAEKYIIQNGELRYNSDVVTGQEKEWLTKLGIVAMTAVFTITFMSNGSVYNSIKSDEIIFPETNPASSEGVFEGWYYDEGLINKATEGENTIQDITLYAKFEDFVTTYIANGEIYETIYGNQIIFPTKDPTTVYGDFLGWYYDEAATMKVNEGDIITANTTIYAKWYKWGEWQNGTYNGGYYINYIYPYEEGSDVNIPGGGADNIWYFVIQAGGSGVIVKKIVPIPTGGIKFKLLSCEGYLANFEPYVDEEGSLVFNDESLDNHDVDGRFAIEVEYEDGSKEIFNYQLRGLVYCLAKGTMITLADYTKKNIEDIKYEDELLVWDFDNGCFASAKPLWIKKTQVAEKYNYIKFEDGTELKTVVDHRIFNMDLQKFTYTMNEEDTPVGTRVFKQDGTITKIKERKVVNEKVNYYNIITKYHMNLFANGLLTSLRLNNLYKIQNMKYVKDNIKIAPREMFKEIPDSYFYGLRLSEQPNEINRGNDAKHTETLKEYVKRLMNMKK